MEEEYRMYNTFWFLAAMCFVAVVAAIAIYEHNHNIMYYEAWNKCVDVGGQPTEQTILGSEHRTFTCVRG